MAVRMAKFPWGDEPFSMKLMPVCFLFGALQIAAVLYFTTLSGPSTSSPGPVLVTLGWIHAYHQCLGAQVACKMGGGNEVANTIAERSLMNTLEQGVPFLVLMWLMAAYVDAAVATNVGALYVVHRSLYPLAYTYYGEFSMLVEFVTQPNC